MKMLLTMLAVPIMVFAKPTKYTLEQIETMEFHRPVINTADDIPKWVRKTWQENKRTKNWLDNYKTDSRYYPRETTEQHDHIQKYLYFNLFGVIRPDLNATVKTGPLYLQAVNYPNIIALLVMDGLHMPGHWDIHYSWTIWDLERKTNAKEPKMLCWYPAPNTTVENLKKNPLDESGCFKKDVSSQYTYIHRFLRPPTDMLEYDDWKSCAFTDRKKPKEGFIWSKVWRQIGRPLDSFNPNYYAREWERQGVPSPYFRYGKGDKEGILKNDKNVEVSGEVHNGVSKQRIVSPEEQKADNPPADKDSVDADDEEIAADLKLKFEELHQTHAALEKEVAALTIQNAILNRQKKKSIESSQRNSKKYRKYINVFEEFINTPACDTLKPVWIEMKKGNGIEA